MTLTSLIAVCGFVLLLNMNVEALLSLCLQYPTQRWPLSVYLFINSIDINAEEFRGRRELREQFHVLCDRDT